MYVYIYIYMYVYIYIYINIYIYIDKNYTKVGFSMKNILETNRVCMSLPWKTSAKKKVHLENT